MPRKTTPPANLLDTPEQQPPPPPPMELRVVRLEATNVKRIRAVGITADPNVNIIEGKNEQGKTSVLDSIAWAISSKLIQDVPIRKGEDSAVIKLDLGAITIERRFSASGNSLVVKPKDGEKIKSPQTLLDTLFGTNTFDAMSFGRLKGKPRLEAVMQVAGVNVADLDASYEKTFEERKEANKELTRLERELQVAPNHPNAPMTETPVTDFSDRLAAITQRNQTRANLTAQLSSAGDTITAIRQSIEATRRQLEKLLADLSTAEALEQALTRQQSQIGKVEDSNAIVTQMAEAETSNREVRENQAYQTLREKVLSQRQTTGSLTEELERLQTERKRRLSAAQFPIPGLSFGDDDILFNGLPVEQASQSQQIRLFFAMSVAMNKPLRICLIREGSLLDSDKLELVEQLANEFNVQVWIERVGEGDEVSVVIEDGLVKRKPGKESKS